MKKAYHIHCLTARVKTKDFHTPNHIFYYNLNTFVCKTVNFANICEYRHRTMQAKLKAGNVETHTFIIYSFMQSIRSFHFHD